MTARFLTPTLAKIAHEQIFAWYQQENREFKGPVPTVICTKGLNSVFLRAALKDVNIGMDILEANGVSASHTEKVGPCGMTNYYRDETDHTIDMVKLAEIARLRP